MNTKEIFVEKIINKTVSNELDWKVIDNNEYESVIGKKPIKVMAAEYKDNIILLSQEDVDNNKINMNFVSINNEYYIYNLYIVKDYVMQIKIEFFELSKNLYSTMVKEISGSFTDKYLKNIMEEDF